MRGHGEGLVQIAQSHERVGLVSTKQMVTPQVESLQRGLAPISKQGLFWVVVVSSCAILSSILVKAPAAAVALTATAILLWMLAEARFNFLVAVATILLVVGSSSLAVAEDPRLLPAKFAGLAFVAAGALTLLLSARARRRLARAWTVWCYVLVGLAGVSVIYSYDAQLSAARALGFLILVSATTLALPMFWRSPESVQRTIEVMFWIASSTVLVGFMSGALGLSTFLAGRFSGILVNPNTLGFFLAPLFPMGWTIARSSNSVKKLFVYAAMCLLAFGILLSGSRAGLLALLTGSLFQFIAARKKGSGLISLLIVVAGVSALALDYAQPIRPVGEHVLSAESGSGRLDAWQAAANFVEQRPLGGWGFGTGDLVFSSLSAPITGFAGAHIGNGYLEGALELGVPGACLIAMIGISSAVVSWKAARRGVVTSFVGAGLFGGIMAGLIENAFETGMTSAGGLFAFPFWTVMAGAQTLWARAREPGWG